MSLLLLLGVGAGNVGPRHDKHDGGFAKSDWDRYQKRLRRRQEDLERLEEADQKRKIELRKQLTRLYRGLPEEQIEAKPATNQEQSKVSRSVPDFGTIIAGLDRISNELKANQAALVNEWKEIERRDRLRKEQEEEEEIEMILLSVL